MLSMQEVYHRLSTRTPDPEGEFVFGPSAKMSNSYPAKGRDTIMSYSRWIDSKFYTYWCSSKAERAEDEILVVHTELTVNRDYTYEDCVRMLRQPKFIYEVVGVEDNIDHLEMYRIMYSFVRDVSDHYGIEFVSGQKPLSRRAVMLDEEQIELVHAVIDQAIKAGELTEEQAKQAGEIIDYLAHTIEGFIDANFSPGDDTPLL